MNASRGSTKVRDGGRARVSETHRLMGLLGKKGTYTCIACRGLLLRLLTKFRERLFWRLERLAHAERSRDQRRRS